MLICISMHTDTGTYNTQEGELLLAYCSDNGLFGQRTTALERSVEVTEGLNLFALESAAVK